MLTQVWVLAWKEFRLWLRTWDNWFTLFLLPILFVGIIGASFTGEEGIPTVAAYVVNEDTGDGARDVMAALRDSPNLDLEELADRAEADRLIGAGKRMAALVIPSGFTDALLTDEGARVEVIVDPARDEKAKIVKGLAQASLVRFIVDAEVSRAMKQGMDNILGDVGTETLDAEDRGMLMDFLLAGFRAVVSKQVLKSVDDPQVKLKLESAVGETQLNVSPVMLATVPGFSLIFVFFLVAHLASTVVTEREGGTLPRLLSMPVSRTAVLVGKALPFFALAVVQLVLVFWVSSIVFRYSVGDLWAMGLIMLCTAAVVAGLGIMIAALAQTEGQAGGLTIVLIFVLAAIAGCFGEGSAIPGLRSVSPHYWALSAFQDVLARGAGVADVLLPCGVLLGMALVCLAIGSTRFRFE